MISGTNSHTSYVYDDENRLIQWFWYAAGSGICSNGALRTDFVYDGLGRLRKRIEYSATNSVGGGGGNTPPPGGPGGPPPSSFGCTWTLGPETHYIYDGMRVIQERDGSNNLLVDYTRGPDLSGTLEGAGGIGGLLARSDRYFSGNLTNHNYYHADGNGNITYLVNTNQGLAASYRYDPFGRTISSSGTLAAFNAYRFSSKEIHANSGMYYYLYRFYDPGLHRWLNRDSTGEIGGINLYRINDNSPINFFDPDGDNPGTAIGAEIGTLIEPGLGTLIGAIIGTGVGAIAVAIVCTSDTPPRRHGDCTPEQHAALQAAVTAACKSGARRCTGNQDLATLEANLAANLACAAARDEVNNKCFKGGDPGHRQAADDARRAAARCAAFIAKKTAQPPNTQNPKH